MKLLFTSINFRVLTKSAIILALLTPNFVLAEEELPQEILDEISAYQGISVLPLDQHSVPAELKNITRNNISSMNFRGYIDASRVATSKLDNLKRNGRKFLKPLNELLPNLAITPAELSNSEFSISGAKLLGAMATGGLSDGLATGIFRLFAVPKLGLIGLSETDYIANRGGMVMIEESINYEVNGQPAVLTVKKSQQGKGYSELMWPTDKKIFTLTTNRAIMGKKSIDNFLEFARTIDN